jgi:hypothetical protein
MPGILNGCTLICSPSARYWYRQARGTSPLVVWRAIPRQGKLPAQLNWIGKRVADECLNLWDEQPHGGIEHFTPLNELQFVKESGEVFRSYAETASKLSNVRIALRQRFQERGQTVRLMFPAWVPQDDGDRLSEWEDEARQWDTIGLHCYGDAETMRARYQSYRTAFPNHGIFVGEWNSNHEGHDERASLQMWADVSNTDPGLLGVTYYIWETNNAGENDLSIWGNPARLALFKNPPTAAAPAPEPIPEPEPEPEPEPTMPDPWEHWTPERIAEVANCPAETVREHWPRIVEQLTHCGINDHMVQVAMIGTLAIETASTFAPVREAFWLSEEWRQANLRYYPYYGRGFIQLTWESNYRTYGPKIADLWGTSPDQPDFDLVGNPDLALNPDIAAAVAALYVRDHGGGAIPVSARAGDWREVRRLVQGGADGLDRLTAIAAALTGQAPTVPTERYYSADIPDAVIRQQNSWTCAVRATYAALWAMAQQGHGPAVTYGDGGPRDIYEWMVPNYDAPNVGLLDHTGAGLASMLRSHGYAATSYYPVSLAAVRELAGAQPCLIGGDGWNHWAMVRGRTNDGGLILENPSPGHAGIIDYIRDSWDRLGPMALVTIDLVPVIEPTPPSDTVDYATLTALAYYEDGVAVPALAAALANPDDINLRVQVDSVLRWLRTNSPQQAA